MPAHAPQTEHEGELLAGYLTQQLLGLKSAMYGLTEQQLRATPTRSQLSVGALVKHGSRATVSWLDRAVAAPGPWPPADDAPTNEQRAAEHYGQFTVTDDDSVQTLGVELDAVLARVRAEVPGYRLDTAVPVPSDAPWWPDDVDFWSIRWVMLHLVEELARHAGHADIIRESIDGATMYELLGALEGWPESDWFRPWRPQRETATD